MFFFKRDIGDRFLVKYGGLEKCFLFNWNFIKMLEKGLKIV